MSQKTKENEYIDLNANSSNHDIRSFFIETTIEAINYMSNKAYRGRIRDVEHEKIKIQQLKAIVNACNVGNRVLKDRQLDDFEKEMSALKNGLFIDVSSNHEVIELSSEAVNEIEALDEKLSKMGKGDE